MKRYRLHNSLRSFRIDFNHPMLEIMTDFDEELGIRHIIIERK
jgi:hypothetical protein